MLTCPRCASLMETCQAAPNAGGPTLQLDLCGRCAGLWIDAQKLALVCPTLSDLPNRRFEIAALGKAGAGIARCPRCEGVPFEFTVLETPIDFCAGCGGVWLDGDEYGELALTESQRASLAAPTRAGPYRDSARDEKRNGEVACERCGQVTPVAESFMSERGLICRPCFGSNQELMAQRRAEESKRSRLERLLDELARILMLDVERPWFKGP